MCTETRLEENAAGCQLPSPLGGKSGRIVDGLSLLLCTFLYFPHFCTIAAVLCHARDHVCICVFSLHTYGCRKSSLHSQGWAQSPLERRLLNQGGLSQRHGKGAPLHGERSINQPLCDKEEHTLARQPIHFTTRYLLRRNEEICPYKDLYGNLHMRAVN